MLLRTLKTLCYCFTIILALGQFAMASNGQPNSLAENPFITATTPGLANTLNQTSDFLPVDQAFQASAWVSTSDETNKPEALFLHWQITPGYYLYRHRFILQLAADNSPIDVTIPKGKEKNDPYFGDVEVYYQQVTLEIPVEAAGEQGMLKISYQGCADAGLCYPPQTLYLQRHNQTATLSSAAPQALPVKTENSPPEQNAFTKILSSAGLTSIIGLFFLAGLALTFTPCVLPMIPIISSIVLGQSEKPSRLRAFSLSLTYVLAMASTYALAGLLTGYFGASLNLQLQLQSPLIIIIIALLFAVFALAMFGLYELRLPNALQNKLQQISHNQRGGTYIGVALIGVVSTLIVSPCVTAPLAGTLVFISSTGDPILGGIALLALGLGMGLPLLLIGTFGAQLLPKSGQWMNHVKIFFGILLLGLAIWMLDRVLPPAISLALWVVLLVGYAIQLGLLKLLQGKFTALSITALALALFSVLLAFNASRGHFNPFTPFKTFQAQTVELEFKSADNLQQLQQILTEKNQGRIAMLDLYADWCVSCQILEQHVFTHPAVSEQLQQLVLIRADITSGTAEHQALLKHFGLFGPPSLLFFAGEQELRAHRIQGEVDVQTLTRHLARLPKKAVKEATTFNN